VQHANTHGCCGHVRRCRECDKAICSLCVYMHSRQPPTVSHALTEITSVVREREVLEEKLARVQETSVEQTRRITAEEEEIKREKQELAAQFKTEEESRQRELEQIQAAAEERAHGRKAEEERRMRALEEESTRLKANAEQEAERRKAEEDEILQQKQKLEEALARVQAHSFRSVRSPTSPRTQDSLVQETIRTPISCAGVAAATAFSTPAPARALHGDNSASTSPPMVQDSMETESRGGSPGKAAASSSNEPKQTMQDKIKELSEITEATLKQLKEWNDGGLIDEQDYKEQKKEALDKLKLYVVA
jgi:hypothetical protein